MELLRAMVVVVVVPLLLLIVEFASCVASCPGSVDDEVPAAVKQEAGPSPVGCVAPRRPDVLHVQGAVPKTHRFGTRPRPRQLDIGMS